ncbi:uncharacterized protein BKA78DRAFT_307210 [Phyllosticta capitalensis]|uniref:uncharacterized protein n=1 Tax=Phyllosticta capitalensis TaxID=121624 RepID=UPI00313278E8
MSNFYKGGRHSARTMQAGRKRLRLAGSRAPTMGTLGARGLDSRVRVSGSREPAIQRMRGRDK